MKRVVLCFLPVVLCGYECGADLLCVTEQSLCLGVSIFLMVSLLFVGCYRRSRAWKPDANVAGRDSFSVMLVRFLGDYCNGIPHVVRIA